MDEINLNHSNDRRFLSSEDYLENHFDRRNDPYLTLIPTTNELLDIYYRLRHEVYCEERKFIEKQENFLEKVKSDDYAIPILLYHRGLNMFIGAIRVILPQADLPYNGLPAIELETSPFHDCYLTQTLPFPADKTAEISRIVISKKRMETVRKYFIVESQTQTVPPIAHLFKKVYQVFQEHEYNYFITFQAVGLTPILKRVGIPLIKAGPAFYDCGAYRQPSYNAFDDLHKYVETYSRKLYNFYTE